LKALGKDLRTAQPIGIKFFIFVADLEMAKVPNATGLANTMRQKVPGVA
jgi:hypothetical protein